MSLHPVIASPGKLSDLIVSESTSDKTHKSSYHIPAIQESHPTLNRHLKDGNST
jgi:hypothetical protein